MHYTINTFHYLHFKYMKQNLCDLLSSNKESSHKAWEAVFLKYILFYNLASKTASLFLTWVTKGIVGFYFYLFFIFMNLFFIFI